MKPMALIAGGGIGGLAAALALCRAGWTTQVFEQARVFSEVGAGIQLGPNVTRQLLAWGLGEGLDGLAAFPSQLQVRDATSGQVLGTLPLGSRMVQLYGAPYGTIRRADLHGLLLGALRQHSEVPCRLGIRLDAFAEQEQGVGVVGTLMGATMDAPQTVTANGRLLVGADGVWSRVRQQLLQDGLPQATGHLAYRALVAQAALPAALRSHQITVWLGPYLHVVDYPVGGGDARNVVAIFENAQPADLQDWNHVATAVQWQRAMNNLSGPLRELAEAVSTAANSAGTPWSLWALSSRVPMGGAGQHAQGRVALLGDAAHPMLPYLAQGAGMAIEDAACLGRVLGLAGEPLSSRLPEALQLYAAQRWRRNARVQARARRNGAIFHATGPMRWGRNVSMRLLGARLLDMPWLYRGGV